MLRLKSVVLSSLLVFGASGAVADVVQPIAVWGTLGTAQGEFNVPIGVAVDSDGNVYVADKGNVRIQKFDSNGQFLLSWGSSGSGEGQFGDIYGITVGPDGSVYTTEGVNQRVQQFTSSGSFVRAWGSWGSCDGQFSSPVDISVDHDGNVYVADTGNHRIQKFAGDGTFLAAWGSYTTPCDPGDFEGGLNLGGITAAGSELLVFDANVGGIRKFGGDGSDHGQWSCCAGTRAAGVEVNSDGAVVVANPQRDRVQVYNASGGLISEFGESGTGNGQFNWPGALAVDPGNNVYVVDVFNHRIQKFAATVATDTKRSTWGKLKTLYR